MWPAINIDVPGSGEFIGKLCGELPAVSQVYSVCLHSPVVLHDYLIIAESELLSPKHLLSCVLNINSITSVSTGQNSSHAVLVATAECNVEVETPLMCLKI